MSPVLKKTIRSVWRRLLWIAFCRATLLTSAWCAAALALWVLAVRLAPELPFEPLDAVPWVLGAGALCIASWLWARRVRLFEAAVRADEAMGLKERLSTAMSIGAPRNDAESAVIEDAEAHARDLRPSRAFPLALRREALTAAWPLTLLAGLWLWLPEYDLRAAMKRAETAEANKETLVELESKEIAAQSLEDLVAELNADMEARPAPEMKRVEMEFEKIANDLRDNKIDREQALAQLNKTAEKMRERKEEFQQRLEEVQNAAREGDKSPLTEELKKAMQNANFGEAAKKLEELKKKLEKGELSEEQKEQLQKQLEKMAEKLGGESKMGEAMKQAAQKMKDGQFGEALAGLEDLVGELENLEAMLQQMQAMEGFDMQEAAQRLANAGKPGYCGSCGGKAGECEGGECQGNKTSDWAAGDSRREGSGMGKAGIGKGGIARRNETEVGFQREKIAGQVEPGKIIARFKVPGAQEPGEAHVQYEQLRIEYEQAAEDTIQRDPIPLEHRELVRQYYDAIKQQPAE